MSGTGSGSRPILPASPACNENPALNADNGTGCRTGSASSSNHNIYGCPIDWRCEPDDFDWTTCERLMEEYQRVLAKAKACSLNTEENSNSCSLTVRDGFCNCQTTVNPANVAEIELLRELQVAFDKKGCGHNIYCIALWCPEPGPGKCLDDGNGRGICRGNYDL